MGGLTCERDCVTSCRSLLRGRHLNTKDEVVITVAVCRGDGPLCGISGDLVGFVFISTLLDCW